MLSRKTGYKIFDRYKEHGLEALTDRSRQPLPPQIDTYVFGLDRGLMVAEARYSHSPPPEIAEFPLRFQSAPNRDARRFQPENAFE